MPNYIDAGIETDPDLLLQDAYDYLADQIPGWEPHPGTLDVLILQVVSRIAAETRDVASLVPTSIFRYFGASIMGIPPQDAVSSTATSTWTVKDNLGYTIPDGTLIGIRSTGDELIPFATVGDVIIPAGSTVTATGGVLIESVEPGGDANGLTGPVELIDPIDFVQSIVLVSAASGGVDAEDDEDYLARLTLNMRLITPRPIIPTDFSLLAQNFAGVDRALAIDGYNPSNATFNNERMVAVAAIDNAGNALSSGTKAALDAYLQSLREVNFVVNVMDPTFTLIDVTFTATRYSNYTAADVEARAEAAVTAYLSPADWGRPATGDTDLWVTVPKVYYLELATVINNVEGVERVSALTFAIQGNALATTDVTLPGAAPLPRPGVINGTVA